VTPAEIIDRRLFLLEEHFEKYILDIRETTMVNLSYHGNKADLANDQ
jgi:hypothetical protein